MKLKRNQGYLFSVCLIRFKIYLATDIIFMQFFFLLELNASIAVIIFLHVGWVWER